MDRCEHRYAGTKFTNRDMHAIRCRYRPDSGTSRHIYTWRGRAAHQTRIFLATVVMLNKKCISNINSQVGYLYIGTPGWVHMHSNICDAYIQQNLDNHLSTYIVNWWWQAVSRYSAVRIIYRQVSNISRTLVDNTIVYHSDVVGASPVGAAPTTSSLST